MWVVEPVNTEKSLRFNLLNLLEERLRQKSLGINTPDTFY